MSPDNYIEKIWKNIFNEFYQLEICDRIEFNVNEIATRRAANLDVYSLLCSGNSKENV